MFDPLVDYTCVILDGNCNCPKPMEDCKYIKKGNVMNEQLVNETPGMEQNPTLKPSTVIVDGVEYVNADAADAAIAEQLANASKAVQGKDNG